MSRILQFYACEFDEGFSLQNTSVIGGELRAGRGKCRVRKEKIGRMISSCEPREAERSRERSGYARLKETDREVRKAESARRRGKQRRYPNEVRRDRDTVSRGTGKWGRGRRGGGIPITKPIYLAMPMRKF